MDLSQQPEAHIPGREIMLSEEVVSPRRPRLRHRTDGAFGDDDPAGD